MSAISSPKLRRLFPEKAFWANVLRFSIPVAIQNMSSAVLGIIDVSVISNMGETAVAAVSLANQLFYVVSLITFGITSGASVYMARSYGEQNPEGMRKNFSLTVLFSLLVNFVIMLLCLAWPKQALAIFTEETQTIADGAVYLLIITPTFLLYSISNSCVAFFRSVNRTKIPMIATIVSLALKTLLNFVLIYGFWGIPGMGVAGAALATLISKIVEMIIYLIYMAKYEERTYIFQFRDICYFRLRAVGDFINKTYAVILNESLWGLGISAFNAIFGRMGDVDSTVSAVSIARQLENLGNGFFYGIAIGACVAISQIIGQKKLDEAKELSRKYSLAGFYVGIGVMLLMLAVDIPYVRLCFTKLTPQTQNLAIVLIAVYALYMPFRSLASTLIMGVMRAGGDSKMAMLYDVVPVYLWSLLLGWVLGIGLQWPVGIVLAVMMFKRFIKCAFALYRVATGKWLTVAAKELETQ